MLLIIATIAVLGVLLLFIWDTSIDQETNSNISSYYTPFYAESVVTHEYLSSPESVWKSLTSLESYSSWFPNIKRLLPNLDTDRYLHQFSFTNFLFCKEPNSYYDQTAGLRFIKVRLLSLMKMKRFLLI